MEDIKAIIAKNITELRQNAKLTQIELAERLNYSDKAVNNVKLGGIYTDMETGVSCDCVSLEKYSAVVLKRELNN